MNIIVAAVIAGAISLGAVSMGPSFIHDSARLSVSDDDKAFAWEEASGPKGERDAVALPLYQAVIDGNEERLRESLVGGVAADRPLHPGQWSALMVAVALNDRGAAKLLVEHGASVDYEAKDQNFPTPLAVALAFGVPKQDLSIFHDLLNRGASVNARYPNGEDVAIHAASIGQMGLVNELLRRGYRRDLPQLVQVLEIRQVDSVSEQDKQEAIATAKEILAQNRTKNDGTTNTAR